MMRVPRRLFSSSFLSECVRVFASLSVHPTSASSKIRVWCHNQAFDSSTFFSLAFREIVRRSPGLKGN